MSPAVAAALILGFITGLTRAGEADASIKFKTLCDKIPDLSLKYKIEHPKQNEVRHVQYTQQQGKFRYDVRITSPGKPDIVMATAYDGLRFYSLLQNRTLIVGKDPLAGGNGVNIALIQSCFLENPLFCLLGFVHEQSKTNQFYLPNIRSLNSWVDTVLKLKGKVSSKGDNFAYGCEREKGCLTDMLFDGVHDSVGSIELNNPDGYGYRETVKEWIKLDHTPQPFSLPLTIECQQRHNKDQPMSVIAWRRIDRDSIKLLDDKSPSVSFVIPASLADILIDSDIGDRVDLRGSKKKVDTRK